MPEPTDNNTVKEVCTIRIVFPVKSDEQALSVKASISALLADIPEAQLHFGLMPMPSNIPLGMSNPSR